MNALHPFALAAVFLILANPVFSAETPPTREEVDAAMGLQSDGDLVRGQRDTLGFVVTDDQADDVVTTAVRLEGESIQPLDGRIVGGVCPHDDHLYAGRVYVQLTEMISAPRVLLIGVFHAARLWDLEDRVVFDEFEAWHGPWGPVPVDPLRAQLINELDAESFVVDNAMHSREHSLEAIVPFLQFTDHDVSIVPLLVPYMSWERIDELTSEIAEALSHIMKANDWRLGRDLAIVVSSDAVHYGDDFDHTPFGTDAPAYDRAVARDSQLAGDYLAGELDPSNLQKFLANLVDENDVRRYRIPWCGRFSIPFGLELLRKLSLANEATTPTGTFLRYGTSLSEAELPVTAATRAAGLGYTAPSNLHHWVGYAAVAYTLPPIQTVSSKQ